MDNNFIPQANPQNPAEPSYPPQPNVPNQMPAQNYASAAQNPQPAQNNWPASPVQAPQAQQNAMPAQNLPVQNTPLDPTMAAMPSEKKSKGKIAIIAIIVLVFLVAICGIVFAIISSSTKREPVGIYDEDRPVYVSGQTSIDTSVDVYEKTAPYIPAGFESDGASTSRLSFKRSGEGEDSSCSFNLFAIKDFTDAESYAKLVLNDYASSSDGKIREKKFGDNTWLKISLSSNNYFENMYFAELADKLYQFTYHRETESDLRCIEAEEEILNSIQAN